MPFRPQRHGSFAEGSACREQKATVFSLLQQPCGRLQAAGCGGRSAACRFVAHRRRSFPSFRWHGSTPRFSLPHAVAYHVFASMLCRRSAAPERDCLQSTIYSAFLYSAGEGYTSSVQADVRRAEGRAVRRHTEESPPPRLFALLSLMPR